MSNYRFYSKDSNYDFRSPKENIIVKGILNIFSTKRHKGGFDKLMKGKKYKVVREFSKTNTLEEILINLLRERMAKEKYAC